MNTQHIRRAAALFAVIAAFAAATAAPATAAFSGDYPCACALLDEDPGVVDWTIVSERQPLVA